jgi:hypothetical protein
VAQEALDVAPNEEEDGCGEEAGEERARAERGRLVEVGLGDDLDWREGAHVLVSDPPDQREPQGCERGRDDGFDQIATRHNVEEDAAQQERGIEEYAAVGEGGDVDEPGYAEDAKRGARYPEQRRQPQMDAIASERAKQQDRAQRSSMRAKTLIW